MTITREFPAAQQNQDMNQNRRFPFTKVWIDLITLLQDKVSSEKIFKYPENSAMKEILLKLIQI